MLTFVAECYWPGMIEQEARDTFDRVRLTGEASPDQAVMLLGCIVLPSDGMALFLFHAPSEAEVKDVSGLAGLPFDRIVESVHIGLERHPR